MLTTLLNQASLYTEIFSSWAHLPKKGLILQNCMFLQICSHNLQICLHGNIRHIPSLAREEVSTKTSVFLLHPSKKCPLHIKSLSGVPEEPRGVPCPRITGTAPRVVMRGHESLLPEGIHQRKWERNPQLIHSTSPHSISTLAETKILASTLHQDCGAHFGIKADQDMETYGYHPLKQRDASSM